MFLRRGPAPHRARLSDLEIGRSIKLNLNSTPWEWLVVHQGLPSEIYDASCNGTWLLLKDIYEKRVWNSAGTNILESSTVQSYLNGDFLGLFDPEVQSAIKQVKIPYRKNGGSGGTDQSGANGLLSKIFLLADLEVGFLASTTTPEDGAKLDYFVAGTTGASKRIAYLNGSANSWWLRSPHASRSDIAGSVGTDGVYGGAKVIASYGIRPAIILPSNFIITDDMLAA
jgi:hypothetical protein